ncbi:MAG TPA: hypothetical protein VJ952_05255, partial [Opitutales bacterium]|nr:hypothetical protein [Opitutales bacterium]
MKILLFPLTLITGVLIGWLAFPSDPTEALGDKAKVQTTPAALPPPSTGSLVEGQREVDEAPSAPLSLTEKIAYLENMDRQPSASENIYALELIRRMSASELISALDALEEGRTASNYYYLVPNFLFRALMELNPDEAEGYYLSMDDRGMKHMFRQILYKVKTEENLTESIEGLDDIEDLNERQRALGMIVESMAETSPRKAYELLESRDDTQAWAYHQLFSKWAANDLNAARAQLERLPAGAIRQQALNGFVAALSETDPVSAGAFATSLESYQERQNAISTVARSMVRKDLESGLDFIFGLEEGQIKSQVLQNNIYTIAEEDPQLAFEYVQSHLNGRSQDNAISSLISSLARKDIDQALAMMEQLPYGRAYQSAVSRIANQWAQNDPEAALSWARGLEDGREKNNAISSVLSNFARQKPEEAKSYYWSLKDS